MKYVMFLQDLGLSRSETRGMLVAAGCRNLSPAWIDDFPDHSTAKARGVFANTEVVVTSRHRFGTEELRPFNKKNLKMASLAFTGYDDVAKSLRKKRQPLLYYVPNYSTDSVAELAVTFAADLLRRVSLAHNRISKGQWDRAKQKEPPVVPGTQLRGKTVGIVGTGNIGVRAAEIFHYGYKCRVIGWSRTKRPEFEEMGGTYCRSLNDLLVQSDVVSLHLPLEKGLTSEIVDAHKLAKMRSNAVLVNTARTGLVDLRALARSLNDGKLAGAGLDITDESHLIEDLHNIDTLLLTPHIGFRTSESLRNLAQMTIENIGRYLNSDPTNRVPMLPN